VLLARGVNPDRKSGQKGLFRYGESTKKTKIMAFRGKYPTTTKILIYNETTEQVSHFKYLGCDVMYEINNDIQNELNKFKQICGTINKNSKRKI
jgi:hypothetical protein